MIPLWREVLEWIIVLLVLAGLVFVVRSASSQDQYHGLHNDQGQLCCGSADCAVYAEDALRWSQDGPELYSQGQWLPVLPRNILRQGSWDGMIHACVVSSVAGGVSSFRMVPQVRCLILPGIV